MARSEREPGNFDKNIKDRGTTSFGGLPGGRLFQFPQRFRDGFSEFEAEIADHFDGEVALFAFHGVLLVPGEPFAAPAQFERAVERSALVLLDPGEPFFLLCGRAELGLKRDEQRFQVRPLLGSDGLDGGAGEAGRNGGNALRVQPQWGERPNVVWFCVLLRLPGNAARRDEAGEIPVILWPGPLPE